LSFSSDYIIAKTTFYDVGISYT